MESHKQGHIAGRDTVESFQTPSTSLPGGGSAPAVAAEAVANEDADMTGQGRTESVSAPEGVWMSWRDGVSQSDACAEELAGVRDADENGEACGFVCASRQRSIVSIRGPGCDEVRPRGTPSLTRGMSKRVSRKLPENARGPTPIDAKSRGRGDGEMVSPCSSRFRLRAQLPGLMASRLSPPQRSAINQAVVLKILFLMQARSGSWTTRCVLAAVGGVSDRNRLAAPAPGQSEGLT